MVGAFGGRGTGKTAWIRQWLDQKKPACLAVWDFKRDPKLKDLGTAYNDLGEFIRAMRAPRFCIRYQPDLERDIHKQFDQFCKAMWLVGHRHPTMFVDELPAVTAANKAPPAWRQCVNIGREYEDDQGRACSLCIVITAQRPAECDKSTIGNCDVMHTGRVRGADADTLAKELGVKAVELTALPDLHWVELGPGDVQARRGILTFSGVAKKPNLAKKVPAKKSAKTSP